MLLDQYPLWSYLCVNCLDLYPIKDETTGMEGVYWGVDYPWPMSDRDVSCYINNNLLLYTSFLNFI